MKTSTKLLSPTNLKRLQVQGYSSESIVEISEMAFGIRFAFLGCGLIVAAGLLLQNNLILGVAMAIAFLSVFLSHHPIDYLYNGVIRHMLKKPPVTHRTNQNKFACG